MKISKVRRWSVDFGNVLVENIAPEKRQKIYLLWEEMKLKHDTEELDKFLIVNSLLVPNALTGLQTLISHKGPENIFIVSRASGIERLINYRIFTCHRFAALTGFLPEHIYFVDTFKEKVEVCHSLNIEGHIDDRGEVLLHMRGVIPCLIWFSPSQRDISRWSQELQDKTMRVSGWNDLLPLL